MRLVVTSEQEISIPQQEEVSTSSLSLEQTYLAQRRREARAQIDAQENLLREYRSQIEEHAKSFTHVKQVLDVISTFEVRGDFVSAELFREIILSGNLIPYEAYPIEKPQLTQEDIQKKREEALRRMRQTDEDLLDFLKEQAVVALGDLTPVAYITRLEQKGNFYRAEIARVAFIEKGLLEEEQESNRQEFIEQVRDYILTCNEDPRRTVNRLHYHGQYEEAHIMAELLKDPEVQRKLAHISIGRDLIKDLRSNCVILDDLQSKKMYEEVSRQLVAVKEVIKEQLCVLNKYLVEEKFTLQQIGTRTAEIDALHHSIQ